MREENPSPELPEKLPAALAAALDSAFDADDGGPITIPADVDAAVLSRARGRLATLRRRTLVKPAVWAGVAAAAVLIVWIAVHPSRHFIQDSRMDIDGNGVIDVLDAFALARQSQSGRPLPSGDDINRDGIVDAADVELVMAKAVNLHNGGHQ